MAEGAEWPCGLVVGSPVVRRSGRLAVVDDSSSVAKSIKNCCILVVVVGAAAPVVVGESGVSSRIHTRSPGAEGVAAACDGPPEAVADWVRAASAANVAAAAAWRSCVVGRDPLLVASSSSSLLRLSSSPSSPWSGMFAGDGVQVEVVVFFLVAAAGCIVVAVVGAGVACICTVWGAACAPVAFFGVKMFHRCGTPSCPSCGLSSHRKVVASVMPGSVPSSITVGIVP